MLQIDDTVISLDLFNELFLCDLSACKGICCIEGDSGAPLEDEEAAILDELLPIVWDDLSDISKETIRKEGAWTIDTDGDLVTTIVDGCECVFTYTDDEGMCKCAIEKAYREGRTQFYKPISCHLYPVRITKYKDFEAVNYHRWSVCSAACALGAKLDLPVYRFLKEPLIRKYGDAWYEQMEIAAEELKPILNKK